MKKLIILWAVGMLSGCNAGQDGNQQDLSCKASAVRVQLDYSSGAPVLVDAVLLNRSVKSVPGDVMVLAEDGTVLASVPLPRSTPLSVISPSGGGQAVEHKGMVTAIAPWPEAAVAVRVGRTKIQAPPCASAKGKADGIEASQIIKSADSAHAFDLLILGDGYQEADRELFNKHVQNVVQPFIAIEPFASYKNFVNVYSYFTPSALRGAGSAGVGIDTFYKCYYGHAGCERLLWCDAQKVMETAKLAAPTYDAIVVIANDTRWGGAGGSNFTTTSVSTQMGLTAIHELGHQSGLADEYTYGSDFSTSIYDRINCSTKTDVTPWEHWRDQSGIGAFAGCGAPEMFRPTDYGCVMKALGLPYCPVCLEHMVVHLYQLTGGVIQKANPDPANTVHLGQGPSTFSISTLIPEANRKIVWKHNGNQLPGSSVENTFPSCPEGVVEATAQDTTSYVRKDDNGWLSSTITWKVACDGAADPCAAIKCLDGQKCVAGVCQAITNPAALACQKLQVPWISTCKSNTQLLVCDKDNEYASLLDCAGGCVSNAYGKHDWCKEWADTCADVAQTGKSQAWTSACRNQTMLWQCDASNRTYKARLTTCSDQCASNGPGAADVCGQQQPSYIEEPFDGPAASSAQGAYDGDWTIWFDGDPWGSGQALKLQNGEQEIGLESGSYGLLRNFGDIGGKSLILDHDYDGSGWYEILANETLLQKFQSPVTGPLTLALPAGTTQIKFKVGQTSGPYKRLLLKNLRIQ